MLVNFIVCPSFLRSNRKTNPFYDPIIRVVKGYPNIDWKVFLWNNDVECGYSKNRLDNYRALELTSVWFYRFCRILAWKMPVWKIYRLFGVLSRPVFAKKFEANIVFTQAGQFADVFSGLLPGIRIVDVQHGAIYSRHNGYFSTDARLLPIHQACPNREFWLYGAGYAACFFNHPDNAKDLQGRVKVIGDVVRAGGRMNHGTRKIKLIVIASQLTADFSNETLIALKGIYENAFSQARRYGKVLFRHHPRFGSCIDLSDWKEKFSWVETGDARPWAELFAESICTMTISSTIAFDAAAYGVPTVLLDGSAAGWKNMMTDEYAYPYPNMTIRQYCSMDNTEQWNVRNNVREWYGKFYAPFTEENCLKLLKGEK